MQIFDPFLIDNRYRYNISVQKDTLCLYSGIPEASDRIEILTLWDENGLTSPNATLH